MPSLVDQLAGVLDAAAGSTDEAFARQFDDTPGGGFRAGFGEELGSSRDSFLTGIGQSLGVVPRGTQQEREQSDGPGVSDGDGPAWGSGTTAPAVAVVGVVLLLLWLIRPLLKAVAG